MFRYINEDQSKVRAKELDDRRDKRREKCRRPRRKGDKKSVRRTHVLTTRQKHDDSTADTTQRTTPNREKLSNRGGIEFVHPHHSPLTLCMPCLPTPIISHLDGHGSSHTASARPPVHPTHPGSVVPVFLSKRSLHVIPIITMSVTSADNTLGGCAAL